MNRMSTFCTCNHGDHIITLCSLHSAAPVLLEALTSLVAWNELNVPYDNKIVDKARAAIRAAKGETR